MKHSTKRILVTHAGSLARPGDLMEMLVARNEGKPYDREALAERTRSAVADAVQKQIDCGVDIVNDGELRRETDRSGFPANLHLRPRHDGVL
jgi:5-methyltetrahydropteroyltriglutamate--homocysteine methyltransferase